MVRFGIGFAVPLANINRCSSALKRGRNCTPDCLASASARRPVHDGTDHRGLPSKVAGRRGRFKSEIKSSKLKG